jgi:hypothetical protein
LPVQVSPAAAYPADAHGNDGGGLIVFSPHAQAFAGAVLGQRLDRLQDLPATVSIYKIIAVGEHVAGDFMGVRQIGTATNRKVRVENFLAGPASLQDAGSNKNLLCNFTVGVKPVLPLDHTLFR